MNIYSEKKFNRGRPTKYSHKIVKFTMDYLQDCANEQKLPWIEELAIKIGVTDGTLWNWQNQHEEFRNVYEMVLTFQKLILKRKALTGEYVGRIASLLLSADHGVSLKRKVELDANVVQNKPDMLTPDQRKLYSEAITKVFEQIYSQPRVVLRG